MLLLMPTADAAAAVRDIVLVLDNSGSMRKNDPQFLAKVAVRTFLQGLEGDIQVALVLFDQGVRLELPLTPLHNATRADFLDKLDRLNYRGLLTNTPAAMERALYELRVSGRSHGERSIILMTDGIVDVAPEGPDPGDIEKTRWLKSSLADEAAEGNVRIFGIAFTEEADYELIQTLAVRTGGQYYRALRADDIDGVFQDLGERLADPLTPAPIATPQASPPAARVDRAPPPISGTRLDPATPQPEPLPPAATLVPVPPVPPPLSPLPPLPLQSGLPQASQPAPQGTTAAELLASGTRPPEVTLPDTDLPKVTLPDVRRRGEPAAADSAAPHIPDSGKSISTPALPVAPAIPGSTGKRPAADETVPPVQAAASAPSERSSPEPPQAGYAQFLALALGGAALLLALAAILIVLRRRAQPAREADPLMPKAFLNDIGGATTQKSYELGAKPIIVGRLKGPESDAADYVVIDESTVGRRHALLEYKEHSFWVSDQNSLNGTFVNNTRIEAPTRLKHGDRVRFHKHEFEFLALDMFETDRTMMSETVFAKMLGEPEDDDDATVVREGAEAPPSPEDPTVTRP